MALDSKAAIPEARAVVSEAATHAAVHEQAASATQTLATSPRILLIVRAGRSTIHPSWIYTAAPYVDVALSVFDESDFSQHPIIRQHSIAGGKFEGFKALFDACPQLLESYDYFWLIDDDLYLPHETILMVRKLLAVFRFALAAPALSHTSFFSWPINIRNDRLLFRGTDFVEIMTPIMSRAFLATCLPHFGENRSGWGQEWLWRRFLRERGLFAAILDAAPIVHTRPLGRGTIYKDRPAGCPDPHSERDQLIAKFALDPGTAFRNLFGVTLGPAPRLLAGVDLIQEMLCGYNALLRHDQGELLRCLDYLLKLGPIAATEDLRSLAGFDLVEFYVRAGSVAPSLLM
jgi:hypothetical protein